jgi:hypothetical protein
MPVTVEVKSSDAEVKAAREAVARSVLREFDGGLPDMTAAGVLR